MTEKQKILIVSHGHPDYVSGGGEVAAYNLHKIVNSTSELESVFFARHDKPDLLHGGTSFAGTGKPGEILFYSNMSNWFQFSQPDKPRIWRDFREVLEVTKPELVHFHHYVHLGIEMLREVKNYKSTIPIVMTLHEYFAICHNHGQMVKTDGNALCETSSPVACSNCFPEFTPQDFFLREQFIKSYFDLVDRFISPSEFLVNRYQQWGLGRGRFNVVENLLNDNSEQGNNNSVTSMLPTTKLRLSYFGQVNWFKGLDLLLDAIELVPRETRQQLSLAINGSGIERQNEELQKKLETKLKRLEGTIRLVGPYQQSQLDALMDATDWVIVPSKWWENSPMVILEARKNGTPVICSDIGGMAEKIEHGVTGLHFRARQASSLADRITWAVNNRDQYQSFAENMIASYNNQENASAHIGLYRELLEKNDSVSRLQVA